MDELRSNGILEEFRLEFLDCWQRLSNKGFFVVLLAAWLALFQFWGTSTLGYAHTPSLFGWMLNAYSAGGNWDKSDDSYGIVVPAVVLVLFWLKRRELVSLEASTWPPALAIIIAALGAHLLGFRVQQPRISIFALFLGLYGLMGLAWGPRWLRGSMFPFFLFAFCMPVGSLAIPLTFRLQLLVTKLVSVVCHYVLAIDVIRQGTQLSDPTGSYHYEVAAACSGIHSLVATVALAMVLGFYSLRRWWTRVAMIVSAIPLAVLGNLLRMLAIIIAADMGGQSAGNAVHDGGPLGIWSLLPYVPAFFGLLWLESRLRQPSDDAHPGRVPEAKVI